MSNLYIGDIPFCHQEQSIAEDFFKQLSESSIASTSSCSISYASLINENKAFAGTGGISENNYEFGFMPAFRHEDTQEVTLSRMANGQIAPIHTLDALPTNWFSLTENGQLKLKACVTSGFVRQGQFYTRKDAASAVKIFNIEDT